MFVPPKIESKKNPYTLLAFVTFAGLIEATAAEQSAENLVPARVAQDLVFAESPVARPLEARHVRNGECVRQVIMKAELGELTLEGAARLRFMVVLAKSAAGYARARIGDGRRWLAEPESEFKAGL